MKSEFNIEMKLAGREWKRQFYTAVVKSFPKTVTEPVTNSDTSYKRKHSLPDASGIVEKALSFKKGAKFDLSQAKEELKGSVPLRTIDIHLYTAKGYKVKPRTCEVVDFAEGMDVKELKKAFEEFAADKTDVSKGKPGRSLFGRGVSDVLLGHKEGIFYSYKDESLSRVGFSFDFETNNPPEVIGTSLGKVSVSNLNDIHLLQGQNGSCVRFVLHDDCHIPEEGTIIPSLSQFYMLRLINADPNVKVTIHRYRAGRKKFVDELDYDFPIGDVIERFSSSIPDPSKNVKLPPLKIDGIVCRASFQGGLSGRESKDQRSNGILIVDDNDAVLDLTFLPQFEDAPYLKNIFGIIRIQNIRDVLSWYLNQGKDSPLTNTRDGFDPKHDFTKVLFDELKKYLEPIYKREEERFDKKFSDNLSKETQKRFDDAIKELNKFLKDLVGEGEGISPVPPPHIDPSKPLQFIPSTTKLFLGKPRISKLYFNKKLANLNGTIIYDTSNERVEIKPLSHQISGGKEEGDYLIFDVSIKCDTLNEKARVTALAEGKKASFEAHLEISDVIFQTKILPPDEMEFRPRKSEGQPNRKNQLSLYVNPTTIPLKRKIKIEIKKSQGTVSLIENGKTRNAFSVTFDKSHIIPNTNIGRIIFSWKGTGWGQSATVTAMTKKTDGSTAYAEARIVLEQPEDSGGFIRKFLYRDMGNEKCSDLVNGIIYINSTHYLNRVVFGTNQEEFNEKTENDHTAQYRLSALLVEQSVFRLAEESHTKGQLVISADAPVTNLREFIDAKTHHFAPKIVKILMIR